MRIQNQIYSKYALLLIAVLIFQFYSCQNIRLSGTYYGHGYYAYTKYDFDNSNNFESKEVACLSTREGKGKYKIRGNFLTLNYTNDDTFSNTIISKPFLDQDNSDSTSYQITIVDARLSQPLQGLRVKLLKDTSFIIRLDDIIGRTDSNGTINFKTKRCDSSIDILISAFLSGSAKIRLHLLNPEKIYVKLALHEFNIKDQGQIEKFYFRPTLDKGFILKDRRFGKGMRFKK